MNLNEAQFDAKRRKKGDIRFSTSALTDPFIVDAIKAIAQHTSKSEQDIVAYITAQLKERNEVLAKAPLLHGTMTKNAVEDIVFTMFWEAKVPVSGAPQFSNVIFHKIIRQLRVDYDELFPLRSHIDKRHLTTPVIEVLDADNPTSKQLKTAAASPDGTFYFNVEFMQALMNYSHLKGVKPKGEKFKSNGGPFPDEYAWIEFLILHEFMHYTNDDFYYQKVIPGADPQIINWVGDFRTNYLLVKSGFEQLPMGLFNDDINYDRQTEYIEMYRLVEEEFKKLAPPMQDWIKALMDKLSDDHKPGNEAGEKSDVEGDDLTSEDIDEMGKENEEAVDENREQKPKEDGEGKDSEKEGGQPGEGQGGRGGGKNPKSRGVDYTKVMPRFNWKTLVDKFIKSGLSRTEETYSKPARRSVTTIDVARQVGAAAIKPAQRPLDMSDAKLMFILDNSGSMTNIIATVVSNAKKLLSQPMFKNATIISMKFSNTAEMFKINVGRNIAGQIADPKDMPKNWDKTADAVLGSSYGGATTVSAKMVQQTIDAFRLGYNVIMFSDSDVARGENLKSVVKMINAGPGQMYLILEDRNSYIAFRKASKINTPNITYFT